VVTVREATAADVEACLDVLEIVAAEGIWLGTQAPIDRDERRERFLAEIGDDRAVSLVAVDADSGRVVGHLGLRVAPYGVADFGMFIAPDYRHQGAGRALVTEAVEAARRLGAHKVALQVWPHNGAARRLYRQVGFVDEGRLRRHYPRRNGEVWDAIVMGLVLDEERPGSSLPDDA
jgi:RimJ/RimL family protein N-acetyltransferase